VAPEPTAKAEPLPRREPTAAAQAAGRDEGPTGLTVAGWVTAATGVGILAAGAVTGIWALSLDADLASACSGGHCPEDRGSDIDRLELLTTTTNVLLGLGVVATATGVTLLVLDPPRSEQPGGDTALNLNLTPGFVGAGIRRRF
jgi:hypothetical protein